MKYLQGNAAWPGGRRENNGEAAKMWGLGAQRPISDYMRREVGCSIQRLLKGVHRGEPHSDGDQNSWLRDRIRAAFREGGSGAHHQLSTGKTEELVREGLQRLQGISKVPIIKAILGGEAQEWMQLERLEPDITEDATLWVIPDIIARFNDGWHLIRIAMETGSTAPNAVQRLELGTMLDWAVRQPTLPSRPHSYSLTRVAWRWNGWVQWARRGDEWWLDESRELLASDLLRLRRVHFRLDGFGDIESLDGASKRSQCRDCGYAPICPVSLL